MTDEPRPFSILLIDDHPAVRQGLAVLLGSRGFRDPIQASTIE